MNKELIDEKILKRRAAKLRWNRKNKEYFKKYNLENKERLKKVRLNYIEANRRAVNEYKYEHRRRNLEKYNNYSKKKQFATKVATPPWADKNAIRMFYKNRPKGMVVDHIIPIQNKNICGLHVVYNLQYLTNEENSRKGNRF